MSTERSLKSKPLKFKFKTSFYHSGSGNFVYHTPSFYTIKQACIWATTRDDEQEDMTLVSVEFYDENERTRYINSKGETK